jgi:hypothetical protein
MRRTFVLAGRTAVVLLLGACATPRIISAPADVAARVPFLRPGETSLLETFDRLGDPARHHYADGVYVWNAGEDQDRRLRILDADAKRVPSFAPWSSVRYELVLQFDTTGTYVRGSLVHAE